MDWSALRLLLLSCLYCCFSFILNGHPSIASDTLSLGQSLSGNQTIVSQGAIFELGFFKPGKSQNSYIGNGYKKRPEKTAVWVANRDKPVSDSLLAELKI